MVTKLHFTLGLLSLKCVQFSSVYLLSSVWLFATPWIAARQASLSIINSRSSLRLTSIESVMPSSHLILCRPLLLLPPIPPSIRLFSSESTLHMRWPKYWSLSFSIIPSKEIPGLISFRIDWLDLLAVQGQGDPTYPSWRKSVLDIHWKDWCWSWNSNTLATWFEELTFEKTWCWERLKAGGEGDDREWDGWMASLSRWTWV